MAKENMKRLNFYMTLDSFEYIEKLSTEDGMTLSEITRTAVNEYIERKKKEKLNVSTSKG